MNSPAPSRRDWLKSAALLGASAALPAPVFAADAAKWTDRPLIQLKGLRVTCSEPVLVKRSRWFCWFPSLIRQPDGTLWAVMNAYADIHVSDSFSYLSRSRDGGLTWDEPCVIGDSGLSHLLLADGSALVIPYYLRPRAGGTIGAPCNVISPKGQLTMRASGVTVGNWPKPLKSMGADLATAGFVFNGQVVRGLKNEYLTTLYGHFEGDKRYSLVFAESADGLKWSIRSVVSGADCALAGEEGPCESAICRLKDGRLMCVFRLASFVPLGQSFSDDDGKTWSKPVNIAPNSVEPSLAVMPGGTLALSCGRPGISVWFDAAGKGGDWQAVDILAQHNASRPQDVINPDSRQAWGGVAKLLRENLRGFTSSYTELMRLDDQHLLLIYDRLGLGWNAIPDESPETNSVWVMRLRVES
ncbi:MAG: hypothetical protein RL514_2673 [Verrucomicrobiota bacterium]|jgi:hypothetical protein